MCIDTQYLPYLIVNDIQKQLCTSGLNAEMHNTARQGRVIKLSRVISMTVTAAMPLTSHALAHTCRRVCLCSVRLCPCMEAFVRMSVIPDAK